MSEYFIARQPIFTAELDVIAYELLFRPSQGAQTAGVFDGNSATSQVILTAMQEIGLNKLVGDKQAFINLTEDFLLNPQLLSIPTEQVVLELLEDISVTEPLIAGVESLSQRGFTIALDDYEFDPQFEPLLPHCNIIKIDVMSAEREAVETFAREHAGSNKKLLAEKVETKEEFEWLKSLNFDYFQGYFFAKPTIFEGKRLPTNRLALVQLLAAVNDPDADLGDLVDMVSRDVSLSVGILKFTSSPACGVTTQVESVRQAMVLMGRNTLRNWVSLLIMAKIDDKPPELINTALVRARICETLARRANLQNPEGFFTVGLLSTLEALMDTPLSDVLDNMPVSEETLHALLAHQGPRGSALKCAMAMEDTNCDAPPRFDTLEEEALCDVYTQALVWSTDAQAALAA